MSIKFIKAFPQFVAVLTLLALTLTGCQPETVADKTTAEPSSDYVAYHNATVYTVNPEQPWANSVVTHGDEIVFVGSKDRAIEFTGGAGQVVDLTGKMLLPGFIDSHSHPVSGGAYAQTLALDSYADQQQWLQSVAQYAADNPGLPIIFGYGFLASAFGGGGPTAAMLDTVVNDRPVFIIDEGFHGGWANSMAMQALGIDKDTADPVPGFSYYKRDSQGNPTGYLLEGTATLGMEALDVITEASVKEGTAFVIDTMNRYGVTAVFDAGALDVDAIQFKVLDSLRESGDLSLRYVASYMLDAPEGMQEAVDLVAKLKEKDSYISMLKIMNDGTVEGKTAAMFTDYQGEPGNNGKTVFTPEQLSWVVAEAVGRNIDLHIHALGERAIHDALNAIENAKFTHPKSDSRFAICHIQVLADKDVPRFKALGVVAQSTPLWASYDEEGKAYLNEDQFSRYFRFNSLKKAGARLSFGSDFPASGAGLLGMSPLFNMEIGHTRQYAGEMDAPIQPPMDERLDVASLIKGYTLDAAYQLRLEDQIGSIEVGKKADMVVLDKNIFEVDAHAIHRVAVIKTILGGEVVFQQ